MNVKRVSLFLIFLVFSVIFVSSFASAQSITNTLGDLFSGINNIIQVATTGLQPLALLLLGGASDGQYLFAKILFLLIIFSIVWVILGRISFFNEYMWVLVIVSFAVSILSTRWIGSDQLIQTIILPYSAVGIAISAGLPFVIYFLLVNVGFENQPKIVRKVAWIFFGVIFIGLWIVRYPTLSADNSLAPWIYPVTAFVSFIMAVMDGTIHKFFVNLELQKTEKATKDEAITELETKIGKLNTNVANGYITSQQADKLKRDYQKRIRFLSK